MPNQDILVIGGGPAGLEAARCIGDIGYKAILVEKRDRLGGTPDEAGYAALTPDLRNAEEAMSAMVQAVENHPNVDVRLGTTVVAAGGSAGNFTITLKNGTHEENLNVGAVIIATGFQHFDPGRETQKYGYYEYEDVITLVDCEKMLRAHRFVRPSDGKKPERVCFIQCVGSRDRRIGNEYCSKVCCGIASKEAIEIRQLVPDCKVFIFYIDMRMYAYWEPDLYWKAQEEHKVNYVKGIATEIVKKGDRLLVKGEDTTLRRPFEIPMDIVILSVGMEPSQGTREMARIFGLKQNKYQFIEAVGAPMDTVTTSVPGVFACGACTGPADLEDAISAAGLAAMRAIKTIRHHSNKKAS